MWPQKDACLTWITPVTSMAGGVQVSPPSLVSPYKFIQSQRYKQGRGRKGKSQLGMLEARGWSPTSKHAGVTKIVSNQIHDRFYSWFTWKPRRRGWHEVKASKPLKRLTGQNDTKCQTGRRKRDTRTRRKEEQWTCSASQSAEKSQGGIQRLEGKIFRAALYKLRGIKWKTGQETPDPNKEQLLEMLGQYFKEEVPSAESCDFSESATAMIEESTTAAQLRLHHQILWRSNYQLEN